MTNAGVRDLHQHLALAGRGDVDLDDLQGLAGLEGHGGADILIGGAGALAVVAPFALGLSSGEASADDPQHRGHGAPVFIFFGLVGTMGTYFLQTQSIPFHIAYPAAGCGLLSVAVLNLNNLRDLENDKKSGKNSIPVRIGKTKGFIYQKALLILGVLPFICYHLVVFKKGPSTVGNLLVLLGFYPIILMIRELNSKMTPAEIDPYLKKTALRTLLLILLFGISEIIQ